MVDLLFIPSAILYFLVVGLLFVYGINFFHLTLVTLRHQPEQLADPPLSVLPRVTIQLPIYNELYVAERLIQAAARLDYPPELLEIQVLDDSTDETRLQVAGLVGRLRQSGVNITHLHRERRHGFKAGALAAGFERANGEFIAVFDADFIPGADFLRRTLGYFSDPQVSFVQARWEHVNRDYSLLTSLQALSIDAHFVVEQFARYTAGYWFNFNGTAGVWRVAALRDAGGWQADTLTEDLDLSYRAFLRGWRAVYVRQVGVPAELPVSFNAYRRQQHRWARGSLECAIKYLPLVWDAPVPLARKIQATLHLTGYGVHLLLAALALLYPIVLSMSQHYPELISLFGLGSLFNITAFAPTIFFLVAEQQLGRRGWRHLAPILFVSVMGSGMMVNTLRAAIQALVRRQSVFERTPKFGIVAKSEHWVSRRYQLRLDPIVFVEVIFAALNGVTVLLAYHFRNWVIAAYALIFCCGLLFTSGVTILQSLAVARQRFRMASVQG